MIWTAEIVRARFVEAADTVDRLPARIMSGRSGVWPAYVHSFEDMTGWGSRRLAEEREMWERRLPPGAAAISRSEEVTDWVCRLIDDPVRRRIVLTWSWCRMSGHPFARACRREGWVRLTAYRRLGDVFAHIAARLRLESVVVRLPDEKWLIQDGADMACIGGTLDAVGANEPPPHATAAFLTADRPVDMLMSPQAIADFEKFLTRTNRRRARERERRRKLRLMIMSERTETEKAAKDFDGDLSKLLKAAKRRSEQLWPGVAGQLELAQHQVRSMMHPDDMAR